ncbi:multidrug resistance protein YpnP (plasmid) [Peptoclostridium acidaminophilum DSM 3953]|uniref:Probable multidrug resistance protein NorM n=2 Tax=Peptoclostridium acidaminophilum TaxID=1731 RepID=W8TP27_PEPAC|nr:multidrug resistance protein YpnP [Peptoclostridium acidaminophilum DSM 3953]
MMKDLTKGNETKAIVLFSIPMIAGNIFQQLYNIVDTVIVGRFIGPSALAAVGSSYTLMVFLTSIIIGLCMGSGVVFAFFFGAREMEKLKKSFFSSMIFILAVTVVINVLALVMLDNILVMTNIPKDIYADTREYLLIIFTGIIFVFVYNYFAAVLRSIGDSITPLTFLVVAALVNIGLDLIFIVGLKMGVEGVAWATVIAQAVSAVTIAFYSFAKMPEIRLTFQSFNWDGVIARHIANHAVLTSVQQSIMNLGILTVQGLVNSFGVTVMAGFAAAVKIDSFAYMPMQDFGNAFSTYTAQNMGAGEEERIHRGIRSTTILITLFCIAASLFVFFFSENLMQIFVRKSEADVIAVGTQYLHIVAAFYCLIGYLFMLYGLYRGLAKTWMSIVLTVISLGTRVFLAYFLATQTSIGLVGIWWAIPTGWLLADAFGFIYYLRNSKKLLAFDLGGNYADVEDSNIQY